MRQRQGESAVTLVRCAAAIAAAGLLAAQPCAAASDPGGWEERRASAFAGVNVRMSLGGAKPARPSARLQLSTSYDVRNSRTGAVTPFKAHGLELGAAGDGAPALYMNGRSTAEIRQDLRLSGSTAGTVAIVFGVALIAVTVLVLSNSAELPGPPI
jgi:hypothetical protein